MGRETVAWNQKVSSWGLTTQPWTPSQAEAHLLVRREGRRGSKERDKRGSCKTQILWSSRGRIHFFTRCYTPPPSSHPPREAKGCVLRRELCCRWLGLRGIIRETKRRGCLWLLLLFCQRELAGIHKAEEVGYLCYSSLMREHRTLSVARGAAKMCTFSDRAGQGKGHNTLLSLRQISIKEIIVDRDIDITSSVCRQQRLPWPISQAACKTHLPPLFRKKKRKIFQSPGLNKQKTQSACRLNLKQMVKLLQKWLHFSKRRGKKTTTTTTSSIAFLFFLINGVKD